MFSKILVPCDVSYSTNEWLRPTLEAASDLAEKYDASLTFLTIVPENLLRGYYPDVYETDILADTKQKLEKTVAEVLPDVSKADCMVREGGICPGIIEMANELDVDLVAMASHGPLIRDYLLGSNATHVALHVHCSVLILRVRT